MKNTIMLVAALSLALAGAACGDDSDNGGDAGSGGSATGGTGGTGAMPSGNACMEICSSPCVEELSELSEDDVAECARQCGAAFSGCESETLDFVNCIESFNCDQNDAAIQCMSEGLAFANCFL